MKLKNRATAFGDQGEKNRPWYQVAVTDDCVKFLHDRSRIIETRAHALGMVNDIKLYTHTHTFTNIMQSKFLKKN